MDPALVATPCRDHVTVSSPAMPTHVAVLPADARNQTLYPLGLPHPRTALPALFLPHGPSLLELHSIAPDASRSWFIDQSVVSDGKLILITPIDSAFILIPFLRSILASGSNSFKPTDDLIEELAAQYPQNQDLPTFLRLESTRHALQQLCETKTIPPDITVQRPSDERIRSFLKRRVERVVAAQAEPSFPTIHRQHLRLGLSLDELGPSTDPNAESIRGGARIKTACEIVGTWVDEQLMNDVLKTFDISAYTVHAEARAAQARAELAAATARAEAAEAGKAAKGKSGEKRKATGQGTRGVDKLKKANTKGMAALTTFFGKKQ